jgi:hypothetical protein
MSEPEVAALVAHVGTGSETPVEQESQQVIASGIDSSIYMWAYTGENIFSSSSSKNFTGVISHMVLKGKVQGFNISIYFQN